MNTILDIHAQCGTDGFARVFGDPVNRCIEHARTFAPKNASVQVTPLVLGDGYPVLTITHSRKRIYEDGKRIGLAVQPGYEYNVPTIRHGFGNDFDKALLATIAVKNGMGSMEAAQFADWATRILRDSAKTEALREVRQGIRVGVERGIEDSIDWPHYASVIDKALGEPDEETPGHLDGLAAESEARDADNR